MKIKIYKLGVGAMLLSLGLGTTSCNLDETPIDYYSSTAYWTSEANAWSYLEGLQSNVRSASFVHSIVFGEMRGGQYIVGTTGDGSSTSYGAICENNFDAQNTGVSKYSNYYGYIANLNHFIDKVSKADYISDASKKYFLGMGYGLRAFYYFDLYRVYGGVPLRLTPDVIEGVIDPVALYMEQAKPSEVMAQIKSDLKNSLDNFGNVTSFDPYGRGNKKGYWSKAATETLAGEVYLWNAKVTVGDQQATPADIAKAKEYFLSVVNNYGLGLNSNFSDVFSTANKGNKEVIFASRFAEGESTNANYMWLYSISTGQTKNNYYKIDGTVFGDPLQLRNVNSVQRLEYKKNLWYKYDSKDTRRDATLYTSWEKVKGVDTLVYHGSFCNKNIGEISPTSGNRVYNGDYIIYRLPLVYLYLAEIANYEGNAADVAKYINLVRARAYGDNSKAYVASSDFQTNELAILHEKDKEFVQEGQRWWDVCRMTLTKDGEHLVFVKEGSLEGEAPLLDKATAAYKVLWPLDNSLLNNDSALKQTPGY